MFEHFNQIKTQKQNQNREYRMDLERLERDQIIKLTSSPEALRAYEREQSAKYPKPKYASKASDKQQLNKKSNNKRRASHPLDKLHSKPAKKNKNCDFFSMSIKDIFNQSMFQYGTSSLLDLCDTSLDTASTVSDDVASTSSASSIRLNASTDDDSNDFELNMKRLFALYTITTDLNEKLKKKVNKSSPAKDKKNKNKKNIYDEEYVVNRIVTMRMGNKEPMFLVKWKGYDELTWEVFDNVYDCKAFQVYSSEFMHSHRDNLKKLWKQLTEQIANDIHKPVISDADALKIIDKFNYYEFQTFFFQLCIFDEVNVKDEKAYYQIVYSTVMSTMANITYYFRRLHQLQMMHNWQESINSIDKSKNLRVENRVDFDMPPSNEFTYTNDVIPRDGVEIPDDPPVGCECTDLPGEQCSAKSSCCAKSFDSKFAYTTKGTIRVKQGTPIFECNKRCKCSDTCINRVVQKGRKQSLNIFKTENGRGWGVRTTRPISSGQYICEYVGEIITSEETEKRGMEYDAQGRTYLFDLDFNEKDNPFTVDAAKFGNVSRFFNHSCDPNLGVWAVWTDCLDLNLPKLCFFTLRSIKENEELTFDYINSMNGAQQQYDEYMNSSNEHSSEKSADMTRSTHSTSISELVDLTKSTASSSNGSPSPSPSDVGEISTNNATQYEVLKFVDTTIETSDINPEATATPIIFDAIGERRESTTKNFRSSEAFKCKCGAPNCRKVLFF